MTPEKAIEVLFINSMVVFAQARAVGDRDNNEKSLAVAKQVLAESQEAKQVLTDLLESSPHPTLRDQVLACFAAGGEITTREILESIEAHPVSVKKEIKKVCDAGLILKVRHGTYTKSHEQLAKAT